VPPIIFRKGLDMKEAVAADLAVAYHSKVVEETKAAGYVRHAGRLTLHLAKEFGFCYGVDRAVDYAYQTRKTVSDSPRISDGRNHPQPARQRSAA
jgi:4-hydroxy-3-methylbut-2-enyl diphosphate reductase